MVQELVIGQRWEETPWIQIILKLWSAQEWQFKIVSRTVFLKLMIWELAMAIIRRDPVYQ